MTRPHPLPAVLTPRDLPRAELDGMRLDGELYRLADGWCSIDELETPGHRAAAALGTRSPRLIAELGTAAWIWGAAPLLTRPLEYCVDLGARARASAGAAVRVRELVLDADDHLELGGVAVMSRLRTAVELARVRDRFDDLEAATVVELARQGGFGLAECRELLSRRRNLPRKLRAQHRLERLLSG